MARMGLSTIGVKLGIQIESTAGTKPTTFKFYENCYTISGSTNEADTIDVTPLDETVARRYVKGLGDSGGSKTIGFFLDPQAGIIDDWNTLKAAAEAARAEGKACWGEVWFPGVPKAYFFTFEPGEIPLSDVSVAAATELEISNVVNEEKGWDDAIEPTATSLNGGV